MEANHGTGTFRRSEERNAYFATGGDVDHSSSSSSSSSFRSGELARRAEVPVHTVETVTQDWVPAVTAASQRRAQYVDTVNERWSREVDQKTAAAGALPTTTTTTTASNNNNNNNDNSAASRNARALFLEDDSLSSPVPPPPPSQTSHTSAPTVTELLHALAERERQVAQVTKSAATQAAQMEKMLAQYKSELAQEREDRLRVESDLADVLFQSQQVSAQASRDQQAGLDGVRLSVGETGAGMPTTTTTSSSDVLWEKMRAREEQARQRVRKEFIEQAQDRLIAAQRRREEAEAAVADALRRADLAETAQLALEERRQAALQELEAAKAELHERYLLIEELRAQIARLERHVEQQARQHQRESEKYQAHIRSLDALAQQRGAALEAQRQFAERLRQELGIKDIDLLNKDSLYEDVLARVSALHDDAARDQDRLDRQRQDMEDTYQLRFAEQQMELEALRRRGEELQRRCDASPAISRADLQRLEAAVDLLTGERDRAQGHLLELQVEKKSLCLQLEKLTAYAKRLSADKAESSEQSRVEREALLRRYESENKAIKAQLATLHDTLKSENEKHIQQVLELSEQLSRFRAENTRLTHHLNTLQHDRGEATRQLSVAQDAMQKLHSERAQLSHSLAYLRDRSYAEEDSRDASQLLLLHGDEHAKSHARAGLDGTLFDRQQLLLTPTRRARPLSSQQPWAQGEEPRLTTAEEGGAARPSRGSPSPRRSIRALSILTEGAGAGTGVSIAPTPSAQAHTSPSPSQAAIGGPHGFLARAEVAVSENAGPASRAGATSDGQGNSPWRRSHVPALQPSALTAVTTRGGCSTSLPHVDGQPAPIPLPRRSPMRTRYSGAQNIGTMAGTASAGGGGSHTTSPRRSFLESNSSPSPSRGAVAAGAPRGSEGPGLFDNVELVRTRGSHGGPQMAGEVGGQGIDFLWHAGPAGSSELAPPLAEVGKLSTPPRNVRASRRRPSEDHFA